MAISDYIEEYAGKPVADWKPEGFDAPNTLPRIGLSYDDYDSKKTWVEAFETFLNHPDAAQVTGLVVSAWDYESSNDRIDPVIQAIVDAKDKLPRLTALFLGDITYEESEISWINQSDFTPLLEAYPQLEHFTVRGGEGLKLRPAIYAQLFDSLQQRGATLVNTAQQYRHCHYLPESYSIIAHQTPQTVWLPLQGEIDFHEIAVKLEIFGDKPLVVKDYVKSRKHEWLRSCFIPRADDQAEVGRVVRNFIQGQGDGLNEGLVFREFVPLSSVGTHAKSGALISQEFRLWFWKNELLYWSTYWEGGEYSADTPPLNEFEELARDVQSNFFSMDVAQTQSGDWIVIELGDGQVAGLPAPDDIEPFYENLAQRTQ